MQWHVVKGAVGKIIRCFQNKLLVVWVVGKRTDVDVVFRLKLHQLFGKGLWGIVFSFVVERCRWRSHVLVQQLLIAPKPVWV